MLVSPEPGESLLHFSTERPFTPRRRFASEWSAQNLISELRHFWLISEAIGDNLLSNLNHEDTEIHFRARKGVPATL